MDLKIIGKRTTTYKLNIGKILIPLVIGDIIRIHSNKQTNENTWKIFKKEPSR